jgi:hypothetical protein
MGSSANQTPATRESWRNSPLPEERARLDMQREFSAQEVELLRSGLVPEQMEDRWFIFLEGDTLYFHRSWSGFCIYQLTLTPEGERYRVGEALVNRDRSQYGGTDDGYDERLLAFLIDNLLLGRRVMLPRPPGIPAGIQTELYHHVAGAGRKGEETPEPERKRGWLWRWLARVWTR